MDSKVLEEIKSNLQCLICMNLYGEKIFLCSAGHDICNVCHKSCKQCPICRSEYHGARNFSLENIARILGFAAQERDSINDGIEYGPKNLKHDLFRGPVQGKGTFKCCVEDCDAALAVCRIVNHCRSLHKSLYSQMTREMCARSYEFNVSTENCTRILSSPIFGLIFICFRVNSDILDGEDDDEDIVDVNAWTQIAATEYWAKLIRYNLQISDSEGNTVEFSDILYTTKSNPEAILISGHNCLLLAKRGDSLRVSFKINKNNGAKSHKASTIVMHPPQQSPENLE